MTRTIAKLERGHSRPSGHQVRIQSSTDVVASQSGYSAFWSSSMVCPCSRQHVVNASKGNTSAEGFSTTATFTLKSTGMKVCLASTNPAATRASCAKRNLNAKPQPNNMKRIKNSHVFSPSTVIILHYGLCFKAFLAASVLTK